LHQHFFNEFGIKPIHTEARSGPISVETCPYIL
jgi:hypothetical protein